jgi:phosphatidate cytidylyltransferase
MNALVEASVILVLGAGSGLAAALVYSTARGRRATPTATPGATVLARAGSYAALAIVVLAAAWAEVPGLAVMVAVLAAVGLIEWTHLFDLPVHHRVGLLAADLVIVGAVAVNGVGAAPVLVGGLVLVGALWPVVRADTGRAVRDLGYAAVGCVLIPVLLVHAVALRVERGEDGAALIVALAVACAVSDVGAFLVGRRFGRTPLAPRLSPKKTREGMIGNGLGAAIGIALFAPGLVPAFGAGFALLLVPLVAAGSVWGDLLESAVKREAGVKDAATWLPGFGGILDRIDSLLITVALVYWVARLVIPA